MYPILDSLLGSKDKLQIDATNPYIPQVSMVRKKYAELLDVHPSGFRLEWLIIMLPIKPKKKVRRNLVKFLSIVLPPIMIFTIVSCSLKRALH